MVSTDSFQPGVSYSSCFYRWALDYCDPTARIEFGVLFFESHGRIGKNVYIGPYSQLGSVTIEEDCLIGSGFKYPAAGDARDRTLGHSHSPSRGNCRADCHWPRYLGGAGSIVLASLAEQTVVGAGSVVTKSFPARTIIVGKSGYFVATTHLILVNTPYQVRSSSDNYAFPLFEYTVRERGAAYVTQGNEVRAEHVTNMSSLLPRLCGGEGLGMRGANL